MRMLSLSPHSLVVGAIGATCLLTTASPALAQGAAKKPNILVIFGDDIGVGNVSAYSLGLVGYRTRNIDRIASEGMMFTDYYAEQSCTAGRSALRPARPPSTGPCAGWRCR
jgi:arylsulfatase